MKRGVCMTNSVKYRKLTLSEGRMLAYSTKIDLSLENDTLKIKINMPNENMQTDYANFEAIAFCAKSAVEKLKVILSYTDLYWNGKDWGKNPIDFTIKNRVGQGEKIGAKYCHYARFLYRAWKMKELYNDWFSVSDTNKTEVVKFGDLYQNALNSENEKLFFSDPKKKSDIKDVTEITENHLEKWFVEYTKKSNNDKNIQHKQKTWGEKLLGVELHDQFPCGVFYGNNYNEAVHGMNRVFNTGYFDLWGFNKKEDTYYLCELKKKGNEKLGIVSELFFYSCLMKDLIRIATSKEFKDHFKKKRKMYRGFNEFVDGARINAAVKAFFLIPDFHSFIKGKQEDETKNNFKKLLAVMNTRNDSVKFDYIWFDQDEIVGDSPADFIDELKKR